MLFFPDDVDGWYSPLEGTRLANACCDKLVLEIGTYQGRSAFCIAQTAKMLFTVDVEKREEVAVNHWNALARCPQLCPIAFLYGQQSVVVPTLPDAYFDVAHIDGPHDYDGVKESFELVLPKMKDRFTLVFHDYHILDIHAKDGVTPQESTTGITRLVDEIAATYNVPVDAGPMAYWNNEFGNSVAILEITKRKD